MPRRRRSSLDKNKDSTPLAVEGIPLRNRWLTWQADPTREKIPVRRRYPDVRVDKLTLEVAMIKAIVYLHRRHRYVKYVRK